MPANYKPCSENAVESHIARPETSRGPRPYERSRQQGVRSQKHPDTDNPALNGLVVIGMMYVTDGDKAVVQHWAEGFR
jgi:hypothetical protein